MLELVLDVQKKRLMQLAKKHENENQKAVKKVKVIADFSISTPLGRVVYNAFSDDELLGILKERAEALGHSPTQEEIFCIYKEYLKARFGKWPDVLKSAGLPRSAGSGGVKLNKEREQV